MPQSLLATIGRKTIDLFSTLRHWNLRNLTLQQESYLTTGMLPYKHSRFFPQYARLYNAAASPASRLRSAGLVGSNKTCYCWSLNLDWARSFCFQVATRPIASWCQRTVKCSQTFWSDKKERDLFPLKLHSLILDAQSRRSVRLTTTPLQFILPFFVDRKA